MESRRAHGQQNSRGNQQGDFSQYGGASFPQFQDPSGRGQQLYQQQQPQYVQGTSPSNAYLYPPSNAATGGYLPPGGYIGQTNTSPQGYAQMFDSVGNPLGQFATQTQSTAPVGHYPVQPGLSMSRSSQPNAYPSMTPGQPGRSSTPQPYQGYQMPQQVALQENSNSPPSAGSVHTCTMCPAFFPRRTDLNRHVRSVHTNETPYKCLACDAAFVRSDARGRHWKESPACKDLHIQRSG